MKLTVNLGANSYPIYIKNNILSQADTYIHEAFRGHKIMIISDDIVYPIYGEALTARLADWECYHIVLPHGEQTKDFQTLPQIYEAMAEAHFTRTDMIIALGGGVIGDLAGFAASTYMRGIKLVQIPTSLLAQVDSSVGGKVAVDLPQGKNLVGAFYQPKLVYMNLSVLHSLPGKQIVSGMGEIIKHGLIKDASYFEWLIAHEKEIWALDPEILEEMIYISCNIKRDVVERDPKEQGERALLNFGHTIGHAIEKLSDFSLYHGECVGLGIVAASYLSMQLGHISKEDFEKIQNALSLFKLPTQMDGFNAEKVLSATKSDKKMVGNQVKFILLKEIGNAYIYRELTDEQILDGIRYVCHS